MSAVNTAVVITVALITLIVIAAVISRDGGTQCVIKADHCDDKSCQLICVR